MMQAKKILLSLFILCSTTAFSQISWPAVKQEMKPWARWWWEGSAVTKKDLTANLEDYKKVGLGGLEVTPIYGVYGYEKDFIDFLSPKWMGMLDHTLQESKRLGLGIDLANGTGWPFGGPTITDKEASKTILYKTYEVKGGQSLKDTILFKQESFVRTANTKMPKIEDIDPIIRNNKNLQALALDQVKFGVQLPLKHLMAYSDKGTFLNVTDKVASDGRLTWIAPEGSWTLYALFEGLHGKMVERAAPGGEGYAIDHFSKSALQHYFKRFDEAFKGHDLSYVRALFNDSYEVDDARGQSNWTPDLFEEFKKRRNYDLKQYLPALFQKMDVETNSRVLYDYRTTIGELILEDFTQEWKKWGTTKGAIIRNQSHGSPANLLDLYGAIDIPETEGDDIMRFKFATSAAHVTGKKFASSESATWLNEHFLSSWGDVKKALDLFILGGVNHIFYHGVNYSPKSEPWPGWLFYAAVHFQQTNPQWQHFHALNEYIARVQSFMQGGQPANDILVYYPLADRYSDPGKELLQHFDGMGREFEGTDFKKASEWMQEHGYSFDFFSDKQLMNFSNKGKALVTVGNSYEVILLPANKFIPEKSFQKIIALAKGGATILVYKNLPDDVPGFSELQKRKTLFQNLTKELSFSEKGSVKKATIGKGQLIVSDDMASLLKEGGVHKETLHDDSLQFIRRKNEDGYIYFLNNRSNKVISDWVVINTKASSAALFDPMFGKSGLARLRQNGNGAIEVLVQLQPFESVILQLYNTKKNGTLFPYIAFTEAPTELKGTWKIIFSDGGPVVPQTINTTSLQSWTELGNEDTKSFSGTGNYTISFARPSFKTAKWLLDLGSVKETAEVILNGRRIATLIGPAYKVVIDNKDLKEQNTLEVKVANLMANRIIYLDKNNIPWKKFYNINMSAKKRENLKNGVFDASAWQPLPSGLLGPVTLTPISNAVKQ
ncbi:MAG TPA: glycosyl hydrolase [Chitinophagaceae bacterium]|nr:glycosyl hydrolase [Chitinophagaceae bacterium]